MALYAAGHKEKSRSYLEASVKGNLDPADLSHARETLARLR
jgi:hypothetical protein